MISLLIVVAAAVLAAAIGLWAFIAPHTNFWQWITERMK